MASKRKDKKKRKRFLGQYTLFEGLTAVGELRLDGSRTTLAVHSDNNLDRVQEAAYIQGKAYTGECLSLIDCQSAGAGHAFKRGHPIRYNANVFPHYVLIGNEYLKPEQPCVRSIEFTTTDVATIFYDFLAFGHVVDAPTVMKALVEAEKQTARKHGSPMELPVGDHPIIAYFSGRYRIAEVKTVIGTITVEHRPGYTMGGPEGASIDNRIVVCITPETPVPFQQAIVGVHDVATFLSLAAGRFQDVTHIRVTTTDIVNDYPARLGVYPSFPLKRKGSKEYGKPQPGDLPLDPISEAAEFNTVLANWIERHEGCRYARTRFQDGLRRAFHYDSNRLVAAANMFDILPDATTPVATELPEDLAKTRDACVALLKEHSRGIDRDSALNALGRMGKPSLPKKVRYRASVVLAKMGAKFPDLEEVAVLAVKCRNFFVHGGDDFDYLSLQNLMPFFTDTLEFIFAASDLIESGWDAGRWAANMYGSGHSFTRYRLNYHRRLADLRLAQKRA